MKAFLVMLMIVSLGMAVYAQPQAPIEWGPIRLLRQAPDSLQCRDIYAHSDTLALLGFRPVLPEGYLYAAASISGNNGLSWSPWHVFWTQGGSVGYSAGAMTTNALCIVAGTPDGTGRGIYRSTDLGMSWIAPSVSLVGLRPLAQLGDTIFCVVRYDSVTWTVNGGISFTPPRRTEAYPFNYGHGLRDGAASSNRLHTFGIGDVAGDSRWRVIYSAAQLLEGPFAPAVSLNTNFHGAYATDAEFDRNGIGILASIVVYSPPVLDWGAVVVNITRDDGETWSPPDTLTAGETVDPFYVYVRHCGPLWVVAWWDSTHVAPFTHGGGWIRFSANWGRSWYPIQQAYDSYETFGGDFCEADIGPDYIRLYEAMHYWNDVPGWYYFQWEGTIRRDTLAPVIAEALPVPQIVPLDTTLYFSMGASDDDSLWLTQVVLRNLESGDSMVLHLERLDSNDFGFSWTVPPDTADWSYYYRAEDMWENISFYPPEGPAAPWTFHVGPLSNSADFILHPSAFSLSVFPVPFNSTTQIEFILPTTQRVSLRLYDVLGRGVALLVNEIETAGAHRLTFDASRLPSGVYLCRLEAGEMAQTRKIVLLK